MTYTLTESQFAAIREILKRNNRAEIIPTKNGLKVVEIIRRNIEQNTDTRP